MAKKKAKKAVKKAAKKPAKKAVKKAAKKAAPLPAGKAGKKAAKKSAKKATKKAAPKKAAKKVVKKAVKKAAKKAAPKKAAAKAPAARPEPKKNTVNVYLNFNGNCELAFHHYRSVFGGEFGYVGRFSEMPPMEGVPPMSEHDANKIMHISLPISKETSLMGSDTMEGHGSPAFVAGNNFAVSINAISEKEADRLYYELAEGGHATMPMSKQFWGSYFGMLTDRFGINWMISAGGM